MEKTNLSASTEPILVSHVNRLKIIEKRIGESLEALDGAIRNLSGEAIPPRESSDGKPDEAGDNFVSQQNDVITSIEERLTQLSAGLDTIRRYV